MKHRLITTLITAACLVAASAASAQGRGDGPQGRGGPPQAERRAPGGPGGPGSDHGPGPGRGPGPGDHRGGPGHYDQRGGPDRYDQRVNDRNGYGPHRWDRGDRLPQDYRSRQYVIDDWRGYRLPQPPRGHQWVGVGADYFLVAVASGVIAQAIFGR